MKREHAQVLWFNQVDYVSSSGLWEIQGTDAWTEHMNRTQLALAMRNTEVYLGKNGWAVKWTRKQMQDAAKIKDQVDILAKNSYPVD